MSRRGGARPSFGNTPARFLHATENRTPSSSIIIFTLVATFIPAALNFLQDITSPSRRPHLPCSSSPRGARGGGCGANCTNVTTMVSARFAGLGALALATGAFSCDTDPAAWSVFEAHVIGGRPKRQRLVYIPPTRCPQPPIAPSPLTPFHPSHPKLANASHSHTLHTHPTSQPHLSLAFSAG